MGVGPCEPPEGRFRDGSASGATGGEPPARFTASDLLAEGTGDKIGSVASPSGSVMMMPPGVTGPGVVLIEGEPMGVT